MKSSIQCNKEMMEGINQNFSDEFSSIQQGTLACAPRALHFSGTQINPSDFESRE
jgi:hypothetical protein